MLVQSLCLVIVVMATALLCSVIPAFAVPIRTTQDLEGRNSSEPINDPPSSPQVSIIFPPDTGNEIWNKTSTSQKMLCNMPQIQVPKKFASCKTLQEVLVEYFSEPGNSLDTSYNTFTLADIFYSGLLVSPLYNNHEHSREVMIRRGNGICATLLNGWLRPQNVNSGPCSWHYNCTYNPDTFPSFKVEAQLDREDAIWLQCNEVRMTYITYFEKIPCEEDRLRSAENWVKMPNQDILVGFTTVA